MFESFTKRALGPCRQQGFRTVIEVLWVHLIVLVVICAEGEIAEAFRRHYPADIRQALVDDLDRAVREYGGI